ncbi:MAG: hypothetical protein R2710_07985 [Acidimicrobiales bacterium]
MSSSRRALHAYVSDAAHERWHDVAVEWGVSVSALLEALAPLLSQHGNGANEAVPATASVVRTARSIDASRRRRSPA